MELYSLSEIPEGSWITKVKSTENEDYFAVGQIKFLKHKYVERGSIRYVISSPVDSHHRIDDLFHIWNAVYDHIIFNISYNKVWVILADQHDINAFTHI